MQNIKLSIITINYNNSEGLKKTLASVAAQTYHYIEHVIVDGGSTDGSVDIIREYAEGHTSNIIHNTSHTVLWVSEIDKGIYNAMNKGICMASGEYIQILNSGDRLASNDVTESMQAALKEHGSPSILYGNMIKDMPEYKIKNRGIPSSHEWTMHDFIHGTVNHNPTYIHCSLYKKYGLYDENLRICSDWKWFVYAIVFGGEQPTYIPINVTIFDMTGISETQLEKREIERWTEIRKMLPPGVVRDYELFNFPIHQMQRLKKHHLWCVVNFMERVLCKLEKKGWIKS